MIEAITAVIASKFMAAAKNIDGLELSSIDDISKLVTSISNSQTKMGSLRMKYLKGYETAKKDFIAQLSKELKDNHPDLLEKLLDIVKNMRSDEE